MRAAITIGAFVLLAWLAIPTFFIMVGLYTTFASMYGH